MISKTSSSDVNAPNNHAEPISDEDLIRGFILALGAGGRKQKTLTIYEDSIQMLSDFARSLGLPGLATMDRTHIRHWLSSLHQKGNKPATVSVRYRSLNRFFSWCVGEEERRDNPMDKVDPPRIPDTIQAYYQPHEVETVVKAIGRSTPHNLRDAAMIMVLYDTGVRSAELCGMKVEDLDWRDRTIVVTGKASKQRRVSIGSKTAMSIERYLRKRGPKSDWLWLGSVNKPLALNGLRMMLERRFRDSDVKFRGAHAFRRGFAMEYLASGGQEGDLKELGGWENYAMVSRCFKSTPAPAITSTNGRHADQLADPDSIPNGERNTTLAKIGGAMRRQGATQESITAALLSENNSRCDPPLPDAEVESIAASVSRYEPAGTS